MKIICIGDIISDTGVEYLNRKLPRIKREYGADFVIVNGENSAVGNGIDKRSFDGIMAAGADVVTGGNHSFMRKNAGILHEENKRLLRPANITEFGYGRGEITVDCGRYGIRVINIAGNCGMKEKAENVFEYMETALKEQTDVITVVDFHAEMTAEKQAMKYFTDGKISLLFGTHTHVQTNDAEITENGTGYITDIGMTGVKRSVIGKSVKTCVHNFRYPDNRVKTEDEYGECKMCGIIAQIDEKTKKCITIQPLVIDN